MKAGFYLPQLKNIREYFNYLYTLERSSMKYDLNNISQLLKALGNPHEGIKFIHIAGTNGKGGTASFLASILTEHGLKTGLFTSPHILRYNERIRINGKPISDGYVKNFLDETKKIIQKVRPSFFEVNTAMAFKYFADKKVNAAVIETGLGGRLDSTNIIQPQLAIITQIGIDHTDFLGKTLKLIAKEKLGIVKPGIGVIVSDMNSELRKLFNENIEKNHLFFLDKYANCKLIKNSLTEIHFRSQIKLSDEVYNFSLVSPLPGKYQLRNINTAILASLLYFKKSGLKFSINCVRNGVTNINQNTGYRARFEAVNINKTKFIFDISHNPSGIKEAISNFGSTKPAVIIFAMMADKDYKSALKILVAKNSILIFTTPEYKRALPAETLYKYSLKIKPTGKNKFYLNEKVGDAVESAQRMAGNNGKVLIIGSFFLVSEAIKALKIQRHFS